ncbi:MAG TPA: Uma2 family endonuclease [Ktedonobacterales bacterium]|nr:Uma2 family endonuclease [Ktedonobacterales bacterium]
MSTLPKHLLTAEEFAALPLGDMRSELIEGVLHTMPPTFEDRGEYTMNVTLLLGQHVRAHQLGKMYAAETGFLIARNPDTVRAPDIAFTRKERAPSSSPAPRWVPVIPDLVVEVASSGDQPAEIRQKAAMWLEAGVRLVWVVLPAERVIEVHHAGQPVATLDESATLDGADIVPSFSTPVATIFG